MVYRGIVAEIPFGERGLTGTKNIATIGPEFFILTDSIDLSEGLIRGEGGATKFATLDVSTSRDILGGIDYAPDTTKQRAVIAISSGDVLYDSGNDGSFSTVLGVNRDNSARVWFSEGGLESSGRTKKLFLANGVDAVMVTTGDAAATGDLGTAPADWTGTNQPLALVAHNGRMIGFGNANDPYRIYISDPDNHEVFTGGNTVNISVYPGKGGRNVAGLSFKGRFFIFRKPAGIYWLDDTDSNITNWKVNELNDRIGTISQHTVTLIDDDVIFMTAEGGVHLLSAVNALGDVEDSDLAVPDEMNQWIRDNLNFAHIDKSSVIYYPNRKQAMIFIPIGSSTVPNAKMVIDFNTQVPRWHTAERDVAQSAWLYKDTNNIPTPMIGDDDGKVWRLDRESRSKDGVGYTQQFQLSHNNFAHVDPSLANKNKNWDFFELIFQQVGSFNLTVEHFLDGIKTQDSTFSMSASVGAELGSFVLGTDSLGSTNLTPPIVRRQRLYGSSKFYSPRFTITADANEFQLSGARVYFRPADERVPT